MWHDGIQTKGLELEMGMNHQFGGLCLFVCWSYMCYTVHCPTPSSKHPLGSSTPAFLPYFLRMLLQNGCLSVGAGRWITEHLFGCLLNQYGLLNWWFAPISIRLLLMHWNEQHRITDNRRAYLIVSWLLVLLMTVLISVSMFFWGKTVIAAMFLRWLSKNRKHWTGCLYLSEHFLCFSFPCILCFSNRMGTS